MSEAIRCKVCLGHGYEVFENYDDDSKTKTVECCQCKGSGAMHLSPAGPGYPKTADIYVPVPKGVNW